MPQPQIVCMGEPMIEFNQTGAEGHYLRGHGGDVSNCAIAAARAGASTGMVTALGQDEFGDEMMRLWAEDGVDAARVIRNGQAHTGIYFVSHGEAGHSFSYLRAGSAASRHSPADVPHDYIAGARILHASGISLAISTVPAMPSSRRSRQPAQRGCSSPSTPISGCGFGRWSARAP